MEMANQAEALVMQMCEVPQEGESSKAQERRLAQQAYAVEIRAKATKAETNLRMTKKHLCPGTTEVEKKAEQIAAARAAEKAAGKRPAVDRTPLRKQPPEPEIQFKVLTEQHLNEFKKKRQVAFGFMELSRDVVRKLEKLGKAGYDKEGHGGDFSEVRELAHQEYNRDSQKYRRACDLVTQVQTAWEARKPPPTPVKKKPTSYSELLRPSKLQNYEDQENAAEEAEEARWEAGRVKQFDRLARHVKKLLTSLISAGLTAEQAKEAALKSAVELPVEIGDSVITVTRAMLLDYIKKGTSAVTYQRQEAGAAAATPQKGGGQYNTSRTLLENDKARHTHHAEMDVFQARIRVLEAEKAQAIKQLGETQGMMQLQTLITQSKSVVTPTFETVPPTAPVRNERVNRSSRVMFTDKPLTPKPFTDTTAALCMGPEGANVGRAHMWQYEKYCTAMAARTSEPDRVRISVGAALWEGASAHWFMDLLDSCPQAPGWVHGQPRAEPTFNTLKERFGRQFCGKVRTDEQTALEELMTGKITQGSSTIAQYSQAFLTLRRKLPSESTVSMCRYFLKGLHKEMHARCVLDLLGREWSDLEELFAHAAAEELRMNAYNAIWPKAALRAMQMDTEDEEEEEFPYLAAVKTSTPDWQPAPVDKKKEVRGDAKQRKVLAAFEANRRNPEPKWGDTAGEINKLVRAPHFLNPHADQEVPFNPERELMPWRLEDYPASGKPPFDIRPASHLMNSRVGEAMGLGSNCQHPNRDPITKMMCRIWWLCSYCKDRHHFNQCPKKPPSKAGMGARAGMKRSQGQGREYPRDAQQSRRDSYSDLGPQKKSYGYGEKRQK